MICPHLKIAAVHDNKQSLAVTLQFIGRFTRTNEDHLGNATFITNIALPPLAEEINELFRQDADWNYILPKLNDTASNEQESIRDFVSKFNGDLNAQISLENIRPAMSAIVYQASDSTTYFNNWREAVSNINKYDYALSAMSDEFLIAVLWQEFQCNMGRYSDCQRLELGFYYRILQCSNKNGLFELLNEYQRRAFS